MRLRKFPCMERSHPPAPSLRADLDGVEALCEAIFLAELQHDLDDAAIIERAKMSSNAAALHASCPMRVCLLLGSLDLQRHRIYRMERSTGNGEHSQKGEGWLLTLSRAHRSACNLHSLQEFGGCASPASAGKRERRRGQYKGWSHFPPPPFFRPPALSHTPPSLTF